MVLLWCKGYTSANITLNEMLDEIATMCVQWRVELIATESNSGAKWIIPDLQQRVEEKSNRHVRPRVKWSNFGNVTDFDANSAVVPKDRFIEMMTYLFDYEWIVLRKRNSHETKLKKEIALYNPDKAAMGEKFKGDHIESGMHGIWHMLGGVKFLREILGKKRGDVKYGI